MLGAGGGVDQGMRAIEAFSGGFAFWRRRGRDWAEEQPVSGRAAFAVWAISAMLGWLATMLAVWASTAVSGG